MKAQLQLIPTIIVNPSSITVFNRVLWDPIKPTRDKSNNFIDPEQKKNKKFLKSTRKANGQVSNQARRKISKAIDYLVTTSHDQKVLMAETHKTINFKIAFITLTLPSAQVHDDKEIINACLNSFLGEIKTYHRVNRYLWRAEKQKNGNIHFHLLINVFIPYNVLRNRWNRIINKLGYVDSYQANKKKFYENGFRLQSSNLDKRSKQAQFEAYTKGKKEDFRNPNSTDVHSIRHVQNVRAYVGKYMTKDEQQPEKPESETNPNAKQTGRIWSCSHDLSQIKGFHAEIDSQISEELTNIVKSGKCRKYESQYFTVYTLNYHSLKSIGANALFNYFTGYLYDEFQYSEQLKIA